MLVRNEPQHSEPDGHVAVRKLTSNLQIHRRINPQSPPIDLLDIHVPAAPQRDSNHPA